MPTPPSRTKRTPEKERAFLDALAAGASVYKAAKAVGIGRRTAYQWRDADPDFASEWDDAVEAGTDCLEDEAVRRALEGTDKPVYQQGSLVGYVREYSDTLMIFMLKARRKSKFAERQEIDQTARHYVVSSEPAPVDGETWLDEHKPR